MKQTKLDLEIERLKNNLGDPDSIKLYDPQDDLYDYSFARTHGPNGYPSLGDQLDDIYHDEAKWKKTIKAVKDKYPKK